MENAVLQRVTLFVENSQTVRLETYWIAIT